MWKYILRWFGVKKVHYVRLNVESGYPPTLHDCLRIINKEKFYLTYEYINKKNVKILKYTHGDFSNSLINVKFKDCVVSHDFSKIELDFEIYYVLCSI